MPVATKTKPIEWWVKSCLADKGIAEQPLGSNHTKFGVQFGWDKVAWCAEYGWDKYADAGVILPIKSASCVAIYDFCVDHDLHYTSDHCVPGDSVIRTWQELDRHAPGFDPEQTHFQEVLEVKHVNGVKYLGLWGGNQGAGYVGPELEWVRAGDPSILGGLAFHRLFTRPQPATPAKHDRKRDQPQMPAKKSHSKPDYRPLNVKAREAAAQLEKSLAGSNAQIKGDGSGRLLRLIRRLIHKRTGGAK